MKMTTWVNSLGHEIQFEHAKLIGLDMTISFEFCQYFVQATTSLFWLLQMPAKHIHFFLHMKYARDYTTICYLFIMLYTYICWYIHLINDINTLKPSKKIISHNLCKVMWNFVSAGFWFSQWKSFVLQLTNDNRVPHWGWNKATAILQTFLNVFSCKNFFNFNWNLIDSYSWGSRW